MPCSATAYLNREEIRQVANEVKQAMIDTEASRLEKHYLNDINDFLDQVDQGEVLYEIMQHYRECRDENGRNPDYASFGTYVNYQLMKLIEETAKAEAERLHE